MKVVVLSGDDWDEIYPIAVFTTEETVREWLTQTEIEIGGEGWGLRVFDVPVDPTNDDVPFTREGFVSKESY